MAWVAPPTFTNGEILSATKLNQLSDAVTFLNGLGGGPAPVLLSTAGGDYFCPRHRWRYLQIRYYANNSDFIKVNFNGATIFQDGDPDNGERWMLHNGTTVMDLDSVSGFVAYGQPYVLTISTNSYSGGATLIRLVTESSLASMP
jgi:hypothetical protein